MELADNFAICKSINDSVAKFELNLPMEANDVKLFVENYHIGNRRLVFSLANADFPPFATFVDGNILLTDSVVTSSAYRKEIENREELKRKDNEERERLAKEEEARIAKEKAEQERLAKLQEEEEEFRHDEENFDRYLNSVVVGTTMKDFNEAIYKLTDSGNEYQILYRQYGKKAQKLKDKLIAKQKQVFPLIRQRYVTYFREAFKAMGRGDIKFVQSGTTLTLLSDEFYDPSVWPAMYESMGSDLANYRFKSFILKSSGGRVLKQYSIRSKNDGDL